MLVVALLPQSALGIAAAKSVVRKVEDVKTKETVNYSAGQKKSVVRRVADKQEFIVDLLGQAHLPDSLGAQLYVMEAEPAQQARKVLWGQAHEESLAQQHYELADTKDDAAELMATTSVVDDRVKKEGELDETGVNAIDIDTVVADTGCSRARAVGALRANNNDVVSAIMHIR